MQIQIPRYIGPPGTCIFAIVADSATLARTAEASMRDHDLEYVSCSSRSPNLSSKPLGGRLIAA